MPFTLDAVENIESGPVIKNDRKYTNKYKSEKANNTKSAKQNYPGSVTFYKTRLVENEVGLFYTAHEPTWGPLFVPSIVSEI